MKKKILIIFTIISFLGCCAVNVTPEAPITTYKIIREKYIDRTGYYIVAEDGTYIKISTSKDFFFPKIGSGISSSQWK